jgi:serine phosphatase RsbU (regulator of sigma subunit)
MIFYTCTDGFADEIGGKDERKYSSKRFRELLQSIAALPMSEQRAVLEREMSAWLGDNKQIDDVLVIGFKVSMTL